MHWHLRLSVYDDQREYHLQSLIQMQRQLIYQCLQVKSKITVDPRQSLEGHQTLLQIYLTLCHLLGQFGFGQLENNKSICLYSQLFLEVKFF